MYRYFDVTSVRVESKLKESKTRNGRGCGVNHDCNADTDDLKLNAPSQHGKDTIMCLFIVLAGIFLYRSKISENVAWSIHPLFFLRDHVSGTERHRSHHYCT